MPAATEQRYSTGPAYGHRLPVNIVDEVAATDPTRPFVFAPRSNKPEDGWAPITYEQVARAVNHVAHIIAQTVKSGSEEAFPTLAYVGPNDIRYGIIMLACIKAGCKALFVAPRNSSEIQQSLLEKTACGYFWYAESFHAIVQPWLQLQERPMQVTMVPSPEKWLSSDPAPFPYSRPFDEARFDPLVTLHTSGSTGTPKPIIVRQGTVAIADEFRNLPEYQDAEFLWKGWASRSNRMFMPMPLFHTAGLTAFLVVLTIFYGVPLALGIPDQPLSADLVERCLRCSHADSAFLPPSIVEELSSTEKSMDTLKKLNFVGFGGGNLSQAAGDRLVKQGVMLSNGISPTENLPYAIYWQPSPEDWQYFIFNSELMGAVWHMKDEKEGIYELIISRKDATDPRDQPVFYTFPNATEWSTGDLYRAHPYLPDHWAFHGRADDIIVFSNGEKLNPITIENTIMGHPAVKGALVVGQDRFQPALIVEPMHDPKDDQEAKALLEDIWELIDEANRVAVRHGRIVRQLISISDPGIPFFRASKGTIQRSPTIRAYQKHIDGIYERAEATDMQDVTPLDFTSEETLGNSIIRLINDHVGVQIVETSTDLFSLGIDSLQVLRISKILGASTGAAGVALDPNVIAPHLVYSNPSPQYLASYLFSASKDVSNAKKEETERETQLLETLISKYTKDLPASKAYDKPAPLDDDQTILLTGSTGSLGSYLLERLCTLACVKKILVLNRGQDGGKSRQGSGNEARGLSTDFAKVEFLGTDLSLPDLGLGEAKYGELLVSVDRIIHNAWPVNLNIMSVMPFEPHIRGVRHLVDFSTKAVKRVPILFISSIGTASAWQSTKYVPERALEDLSLANTGYGRSKLAASLILDSAVRYAGTAAASVRVGQIAGPRSQKGMWNKQEYIPSMIASSLYLGMLPDNFGTGEEVDWMAIEDVTALILDVAGITTNTPVSAIDGYFHSVNPAKTTWGQLAGELLEYYSGRVRLVSFEEWVTAIEKSASTTTDISRNPAIKLLDLYKGMLQASRQGLSHVNFEMSRTMSRSRTVAQLGPITADLLRNWCSQWGFESDAISLQA
ncbi:hypothetical protein XA68_11773 [Ophiocordyceps unilateralis]|uniref:Carrier domain-containing protein n=1 Tax=Ophiocordyceps unilateralis TaxID=268505 RepID=A0A2A9PG30_OPHUN|nr:hypothetical protein XA68_11773 [Ophiocordyceps unilateralis]